VAAKIINKVATEKLGPLVASLQLGVGVKGGMEAAVHATLLYLQDMSTSNCAMAKLDFKNAFNTICRDTMLEAVHHAIPESCSFIYASNSILFYGSDMLSSEEGSAGLSPWAMALLPGYTSNPHCLHAKLRVGYMDDITLRGELSMLRDEVAFLKTRASALGLVLNESKCELIASTLPPTLPQTLA
jgi:hypothetical protein